MLYELTASQSMNLPHLTLLSYHIVVRDLITSPRWETAPTHTGTKKAWVTVYAYLANQVFALPLLKISNSTHAIILYIRPRGPPIYKQCTWAFVATISPVMNQSCEVRLARDDILKRFPKSIWTEGGQREAPALRACGSSAALARQI